MGHEWVLLVGKSVALANSTVTYNVNVSVYSWPVCHLMSSAFGYLNPKVFMLGGITSLFPLKIKLFTMCRSLMHQYSAIPLGSLCGHLAIHLQLSCRAIDIGHQLLRQHEILVISDLHSEHGIQLLQETSACSYPVLCYFLVIGDLQPGHLFLLSIAL